MTSVSSSKTSTNTSVTRKATDGNMTSHCTCSLCREGAAKTVEVQTSQNVYPLRQVVTGRVGGKESSYDTCSRRLLATETSDDDESQGYESTFTGRQIVTEISEDDETPQPTCSRRQLVTEVTGANQTSQNTCSLRVGRSRAKSSDRMEEKQQLQNLNDRFASYIDRVRYLESENSRLVSQVRMSEHTVSQGVENVKYMYDKELDDARKLLDNMSNEKARMKLEAEKYKTEAGEWQTKYYRINSDGQGAEKKILELETRIADLHGRYAEIESQKNHFEKQQNSAASELISLESQLGKTKKQLEAETLHRVDLENSCQTLKEDIAFKSQVFEQELGALRTRTSIRVDEVDAGARVDYEAKLREDLRRMRIEQEEAISATRGEVEAMYARKVADLETSLQRAQSSGVSVRDDMITSRRQFSELSTEVTTLKAQIAQYESRITDLESQLRLEQEGFFSRIADKDTQIAGLRQSLDEQLKEFAHLMDIKIRLDTEIAAYRKLLESEEDRLNISNRVQEGGLCTSSIEKATVKETIPVVNKPSYSKGLHSYTTSYGGASRFRGISGGTSYRSLLADGRKRKHVTSEEIFQQSSNGQSSSNAVSSQNEVYGDSSRFRSVSGGINRSTFLTSSKKRKQVASSAINQMSSSASGGYSAQSQAKGSVEIYEIDTKGKFIKLRNITNKDIYLGSWQLKHVADDQEIVYKFHRSVILKGGEYTTVWSSNSGKIQSRPSTLVMKGQKWIVGDEMNTFLYNNDGDEVATRHMIKSKTENDTTTIGFVERKVAKVMPKETERRITRKVSRQ